MFFFKGSKGRSLLGFLYEHSNITRSTGIVFCHPFAEESNVSHAIVVKTSRAIAKLGYSVLLFDMSGCGDSEGELSDVILDDWQDDLVSAINILKSETTIEYIALWGLRLGAGLALLHAVDCKDIAFIVLWQPVVDFKEYIHKFLRTNISSQIVEQRNSLISVSKLRNQLKEQGIVFVNGYPITEKLFESFDNVAKQPYFFEVKCPTLLLSISLMETPAVSIKRYYDLLHSKVTSVEFSHIIAEPFWDRYWRWECQKVTDATLRWLNSL